MSFVTSLTPRAVPNLGQRFTDLDLPRLEMWGAETGRGVVKHGSCLGRNGDGGEASIFLILVNSSHCRIYFSDTSSQRSKTDGQALSWTVFLLAVSTVLQKPLILIMQLMNLHLLKKSYIVNLQLYMKNINELYFMFCLYIVSKLKFWVRGKNCVSLGT
jgi:hypothetical protein